MTVVPLGQAPAKTASPSSSAVALRLQEISERLPQGLLVRRSFGGLDIRSTRRNWTMIGVLTLFCAFWDTAFLFMALKGQLPLLFWFSHGLSGLGVTWLLVNLLINHTQITIERGHLRVRRGPFPWPGGKTIEISGLQRLWVAPGHTKVNGRALPALWLAQSGVGEQVLLDALPNEELGRALERLIEDHLHIDESASP